MAQQDDIPNYMKQIQQSRTPSPPRYAPKAARGMTDESRTNAIARGQGSLIPQGYTYAQAMKGDLPPTLIGGWQNPEMFDSQTGRSTGMRRNDFPPQIGGIAGSMDRSPMGQPQQQMVKPMGKPPMQTSPWIQKEQEMWQQTNENSIPKGKTYVGAVAQMAAQMPNQQPGTLGQNVSWELLSPMIQQIQQMTPEERQQLIQSITGAMGGQR